MMNFSETSLEDVVEILDIRLDTMDGYSQEGKLLNSVGDRITYANTHYDDAQIAIDINVEPHRQNTIYIKFMNEDKSDLTYEVYDKEEYINSLVFKKVMHAFFFGALIIMLVYNIVLYLFIREKAFLIYIVYHIILMVVMLYYNGLVSQYYYPDSFDKNGGNVPVALSYVAIICAIEFLREFLNVKKHTPKIVSMVTFLCISQCLVVAFSSIQQCA